MKPFEEKCSRRFVVCCQDLSLNLLAQLSDRSEGGPTNVRGALACPALSSFSSPARKTLDRLIWVDKNIPFCHELRWDLGKRWLLAQGHCRICLPWYFGVPKMCLGTGSVPTWLSLPGTGSAGKPAAQRHREWGACAYHVLVPCESPVGK